jgi:hypothetical protein
MMDLQWFDFVGFAGVLIVLGAYAALQTGRMDGNGLMYSLLNLLGAAGILVSVWYATKLNWPVLFIETIWILMSAYGIHRCLHAKIRDLKGTRP